jgi:hypothetical protein
LEIRGECASETPAEIKTPSPREAELAARAAELENVLAAPSATRPMGGATSPPVPLRRYWLTNWGRTHADCAVQQFVTPPVDFALPTLRNKGRPIRFKEEPDRIRFRRQELPQGNRLDRTGLVRRS